MKKGFTIQLNAENRQRPRHTTQQQMIISYTMGGGDDKDLINAECRASFHTMKQGNKNRNKSTMKSLTPLL